MVYFDRVDWSAAVANLRSLASQGRLAEVARSASADERVLLSGAAFTLAWPIVFNRMTRVYEQRRGHRACAVAVDQLAEGCLDRFHDDVEAVVDDLLNHATDEDRERGGVDHEPVAGGDDRLSPSPARSPGCATTAATARLVGSAAGR